MSLVNSTSQISLNSSEELPSLSDRITSIRKRISDAAAASNRAESEITLIAVTKFHPADIAREVYEAGVSDLAESRPQEFLLKQQAMADLSDVQWHFVGQLQRNKAKFIRSSNAIIHSVDRSSLIDALARGSEADDVQQIFLQLNLTDDPNRGGVAPDDLLSLADYASSVGQFSIKGVMAVPGLGKPLEEEFAKIHEASERLRSILPDAKSISAGMSGDFETAIRFGATHLRIGTAITGPRDTTR